MRSRRTLHLYLYRISETRNEDNATMRQSRSSCSTSSNRWNRWISVLHDSTLLIRAPIRFHCEELGKKTMRKWQQKSFGFAFIATTKYENATDAGNERSPLDDMVSVSSAPTAANFGTSVDCVRNWTLLVYDNTIHLAESICSPSERLINIDKRANKSNKSSTIERKPGHSFAAADGFTNSSLNWKGKRFSARRGQEFPAV